MIVTVGHVAKGAGGGGAGGFGAALPGGGALKGKSSQAIGRTGARGADAADTTGPTDAICATGAAALPGGGALKGKSSQAIGRTGARGADAADTTGPTDAICATGARGADAADTTGPTDAYFATSHGGGGPGGGGGCLRGDGGATDGHVDTDVIRCAGGGADAMTLLPA